MYHIVAKISIDENGVNYSPVGYVEDVPTAQALNEFHTGQEPVEYIVYSVSENDGGLPLVTDIEDPEAV